MRKEILYLILSFTGMAGISAQTVRVDTVMMVGHEKKEMKTLVYTENNLLATETFYALEDQTWKWNNRLEYEYYSDKRLKTSIHSTWEEEQQAWIDRQKYAYEYNENTMTERTYQYAVSYIDGQPQWGWWESESNRRKCEYTYNIQGDITLITFYYWHFVEKRWEVLIKNTYEYADNRLKSITEWIENDMMGKTEFEYDEKGNIIEKKFLNGKINYEYDENGNLTIERYHTNPCCNHHHEGECEHEHEHDDD